MTDLINICFIQAKSLKKSLQLAMEWEAVSYNKSDYKTFLSVYRGMVECMQLQ